jgi:hypothetical protein
MMNRSRLGVLAVFRCDALARSAVSDQIDLIRSGDEDSPANGSGSVLLPETARRIIRTAAAR